VYGSERHVLLRHYLEAGLTKTAIAERLGLDRSTIHRWIRTGDLERDVDADAVRYRPRPPRPSKLDPYEAAPPGATDRLFRRHGGPPLRRNPGGRVPGRPESTQGAGASAATAAARRGGRALRDAAGSPGPSGFRSLRAALGRALRAPCGPQLLPAPLAPLRAAPGSPDPAHRARGRLRQLRRGAPGAPLRPDEGGHYPRRAARGGGRLVTNVEFLRFAHHWGFAPAPAARIGRGPRAKSSGRSATCGRASSTAAASPATPTSKPRPSTGWRPWPMCAAMPRRWSSRSSASSGTNAPACSRSPHDRTGRSCSCRQSRRHGPGRRPSRRSPSSIARFGSMLSSRAVAHEARVRLPLKQSRPLTVERRIDKCQPR
jgi:hypothetical protein